MTLHGQTIGVGGRRGSGRRAGRGRSLAVLGVVAAGVALAACKGAAPPVPGNPEIAFTLDSSVSVSHSDTVHGLVVATGDRDLVTLEIIVIDTSGTDSTSQLIGGGTSAGAGKLTDSFAYRVLHTLPGAYVRFSAIAFDYFGDSTIVIDSTLVKS
jgi:hypothetical protein